MSDFLILVVSLSLFKIKNKKNITIQPGLPLLTGLRFHSDVADIAGFPCLYVMSTISFLPHAAIASTADSWWAHRLKTWHNATLRYRGTRYTVGHRKSDCMKACLSAFFRRFLFQSMGIMLATAWVHFDSRPSEQATVWKYAYLFHTWQPAVYYACWYLEKLSFAAGLCTFYILHIM